MKTQTISGIHHITAISSSARENLAFYETTLGLRLVKQTVNFDDPTTYHLYYGDDRGTPGTLLTFFPWDRLPQGTVGAGMVTAVAFAVPRESLEFWLERLSAAGIGVATAERFGEPVIRFADPHGLPLELIGIARPPGAAPRETGTVPGEQAITGFHSATATLPALEPIASLLESAMGLIPAGREGNRHRFRMNDMDGYGQVYDVIVDPLASPGRAGTGTVHHIAFRTVDDESQRQWQSILRSSGFGVTEVRDRQYFRSIYFHSPGGVLFEIATDGPGFAVDENPAELGSSLKLPPQYEPSRTAIAGQLPALRAESFRHVFRPPAGEGDGWTTVALHGTGGGEHDLLELAGEANPAAAVIGVRGRVLENGMARFFRRLSENVFDEREVAARAHELAEFLGDAASKYGCDGNRLAALGYSNGANIAAALLFLRPEVFAQAILIRPMLPLQDPDLPDLQGKDILLLRGARDRMIPAEATDRLVEKLQAAGARLTVRTFDAGHEITGEDIGAIRRWVSERRG